ncbi:MAG TPA: hypothetical protein P5274_01180 [Candidatus Paceibacterota bacterium]|nr:hypothetical protein [Candidatus Paceibacterota bacterium]
MTTNTQAPPGKKRRQYYTGESFSLKDATRLEFTSPDGRRKEIFETKGPFIIAGICIDQERVEDEFYYVILADYDHPRWTTEIPMDMIVQNGNVPPKKKGKPKRSSWLPHFLRRK